MGLIKMEWKKIVKTPVMGMACLVLFALNVFLFATMENTYFAPASEDGLAHIQQQKEQDAYFRGAVTEAWAEKFQAEAEAILTDPDNQLSGKAREAKIQELMDQGYSRTYIEENLQTAFLDPDSDQLERYDQYESVAWASSFYVRAAERGERLAAYYGESFDGEKADALTAAAKEAYRALAEDYTAYYNYNLGYGRMSGILMTYGSTLGLLILAGLAGIFNGEYGRKTDSLILCAKYGRQKIASAKIKAGLLFAAAAWMLMTLLNLAMTTYFYGWTGWESFWQDWIVVTAPFQWNQGTAMVIGMGTSLLGALYWAAVVMLLSAAVKRTVTAVFFGAAVLFLPAVIMENLGSLLSVLWLHKLYELFPAVILKGEQIWCGYDGLYFFGKVLNWQPILICLAVVLTAGCCLWAVRIFSRHQAEN